MNPITLATILAKIFGLDIDRALKYARIIFVGAILLIVLAFGAFIYNCNQRRTETKIGDLGANILEGKVNANIAGAEVNRAVQNTNQANGNLSNVMNRNVTSYNGNANNALKRFDCEIEGIEEACE